jgi:hypothetical protein
MKITIIIIIALVTAVSAHWYNGPGEVPQRRRRMRRTTTTTTPDPREADLVGQFSHFLIFLFTFTLCAQIPFCTPVSENTCVDLLKEEEFFPREEKDGNGDGTRTRTGTGTWTDFAKSVWVSGSGWTEWTSIPSIAVEEIGTLHDWAMWPLFPTPRPQPHPEEEEEDNNVS